MHVEQWPDDKCQLIQSSSPAPGVGSPSSSSASSAAAAASACLLNQLDPPAVQLGIVQLVHGILHAAAVAELDEAEEEQT